MYRNIFYKFAALNNIHHLYKQDFATIMTKTALIIGSNGSEEMEVCKWVDSSDSDMGKGSCQNLCR